MLNLRLLNPNLISQNRENYQRLTYPRYRPLLDNLQDSRYIAISAEDDQEILGLAIGEVDYKQNIGEVLSLFVIPEYRRQGIGNELLIALETEIRGKNCQQIDLIFIPNKTVIALEKILQKNGWSEPKARMLIALGDPKTMRNVTWLNLDQKLPLGYEIFPWRKLTSKERKTIQELQKKSPWYPDILSPFTDEDIIEPINSLGLRYNHEVVGWMITHRISKNTIRYTKLFVKEELQSIGRGIALLGRAIKLQINHPEINQCSFTVQIENEKMVKFTERRFKPYLDSFRKSFISSKLIPNMTQLLTSF
ncbi:GNAT family N-acetyltransferase [Dapis sp. BLCC M229]|uniref:GNAT family N-acetyltransferase n=1 Tax=Dapis sp. BLCC M229 TaxID=3400188 RepID=UPI003CF6FE00